MESSRTLRAKYKVEVNWNEKGNPKLPENHPWKYKGFESPDPYLETMVSRWAYDAQGRIVEEVKPLEAGITRYGYHVSGRLHTVQFSREDSSKAGVASIRYNARNQREKIRYENGVVTKYEYDPDTWSLESLISERNGARIQEIQYTFDPVKNITRLRDHSHKVIFTNNSLVEPLNDYTYDALYRLTRSTGRHRSGTTNPDTGQPDYVRFFTHPASPNDDNAIRNYTRQYRYDAGDNLTQIKESQGITRALILPLLLMPMGICSRSATLPD
jgi:hypothetical protein